MFLERYMYTNVEVLQVGRGKRSEVSLLVTSCSSRILSKLFMKVMPSWLMGRRDFLATVFVYEFQVVENRPTWTPCRQPLWRRALRRVAALAWAPSATVALLRTNHPRVDSSGVDVAMTSGLASSSASGSPTPSSIEGKCRAVHLWTYTTTEWVERYSIEKRALYQFSFVHIINVIYFKTELNKV